MKASAVCNVVTFSWFAPRTFFLNFFQKKVLKKFVGSKKSSTFALAFDKEPPCNETPTILDIIPYRQSSTTWLLPFCWVRVMSKEL